MKKTRNNSIVQCIKAFLLFISKLYIGLILFLVIPFCAYASLFFIQYAILAVAYVEPPLYPNVHRLPGAQGSGSGGYWAYKNFCTPDDYSDVIEFMRDYFPRFEYDSEEKMYYSAQSNGFADIIAPIVGISQTRYIVVYETIPDNVTGCFAGTYFVIFEDFSD